MKICFLADASHINCRNWAKYLASELKHDVTILSLEKVNHGIEGVRIYYIETPIALKKAKYLYSIIKVKRTIKIIKPDILIGYRVSSYGFLAACSGFHPVVLVAQGYNIDNPENSNLKEFFIRYAIRKADMFHAWGLHMKECFEELGAQHDKIITFPRGINTKIFKFYKVSEGKFTIIMTRGLKQGYNLHMAIKAMAGLKKDDIEFIFLIAGDGPIKNKLESLAKKLRISDQVRFLGYIENNELPEIMKNAHAYVSPVPTDGVSASMLEAMACGLIPIVIDNEANRFWIKNNINGYLCKKGNHTELTEALKKVANHDIDIQNMRLYNRELVCRNADWEVNMMRLEREYQNLLYKYRN